MLPKYTPIVLFTYNRLVHTQRTIEALQKNYGAKESNLYIFSDGPKKPEDKVKVAELRKYLKTIKHFKKVTIIERKSNFGLANSIIDGVTKVVNEHGSIIVLEDDMVTSPYFLQFMNDGLKKYEHEDKVISIHGYVYPVKEKLPKIFFLRGADCWGWATWKRGWGLFEKDGQKLLDIIEKNKWQKDFDFNYNYGFTQMLRDQIAGKNNSWAIRWNASAYVKTKLTLYPGQSFVQNIGLDKSGTHCGDTEEYTVKLCDSKLLFPEIEIKENNFAKKAFEKYFNSLIGNDKLNWLKRKLSQELFSKYIVNIVKKIITNISPPVFIKLFRKKFVKNDYGWFYSNFSWNEIMLQCEGYDSDKIFNKVKIATQKVIEGQYAFERDSVLFSEQQFSFPLVSSLFFAHNSKGYLNVLDYGGALGSIFYQHKLFFRNLKNFSWSIVEQKKFNEIGRSITYDKRIKYFDNIYTAFDQKKINMIVLSSVLQYIEEPFKLIEEILSHKVDYIFIDLTGIVKSENDVLTIQKVPPEIYEAAYPCWFFNENKLINAFSNEYELVYSFDSYINNNIEISPKLKASYKGYLWEKLR